MCRDAIRHYSRGLAVIAILAVAPAWAGATLPHGAPTGQRIATGSQYTCAITDSGLVKCWGHNESGVLGDGSFLSHDVPSTVRGNSEQALALAGGYDHVCALTLSGTVKCWGNNSQGQLGDGSTNNSATPVDVVGLTGGVVSITAGQSHTCAITSAAELKCWGGNFGGQLGDGTTTARHVPVHTSFGISAVAAGASHTCAVTQTGIAQCWGMGNRGQLGNNATSSQQLPVEVTGLSSPVSAITAGLQHSCALMMTGAVKCWGANQYGQLGDSTNTDRLIPVDITSLASNVTVVNAGSYHTCAVQQGAVKCWGYNSTGRLGDGSRANSATPVAVTGLTAGVQQIDAGSSHSCAWMGGDAFSCWGNNTYGQIGVGSVGRSTQAVDVIGLDSGTSAIGVGSEHVCAIRSGAVFCWGDNRLGQLGNGNHDEHATPTATSGLESDVASLSLGGDHACALTQDGSAKCWGDNAQGQLGDNTQMERTTPVDVVGLGAGVRQIATASEHSCALTATGGVKCWGSNQLGELGNNSTDDHFLPGDVAGLTSGVAAISVGSVHSCALLDAGNVKCWGFFPDNSGGGTPDLAPIDVPGLASNVTAITSGAAHDCAVIGGSLLKCWGLNDTGALGNGTTDNSSMNPVDVAGLNAGVSRVSAGNAHTCAIDTTGAAKCWGVNDVGELGDGTEEYMRLAPVDVIGLGSGISYISAGDSGSCGVSTGGTARCWGENLFGQLGNGEIGSVLVPLAVLIDEEIFRSGFE
ncbi:MAG: hypothetical protein ABIQ70_14590 [Dokdonella sp.]